MEDGLDRFLGLVLFLVLDFVPFFFRDEVDRAVAVDGVVDNAGAVGVRGVLDLILGIFLGGC